MIGQQHGLQANPPTIRLIGLPYDLHQHMAPKPTAQTTGDHPAECHTDPEEDHRILGQPSQAKRSLIVPESWTPAEDEPLWDYMADYHDYTPPTGATHSHSVVEAEYYGDTNQADD